jgi:hypothetical protein
MPVPLQPAPSSVALLDPYLGTNVAGVSPAGNLRVELPALQLFWEGFNTSTLDTVVRWSATAGGTGVAPTNAQTVTVLSGGTTLNSFSRLQSLPSFGATQPGFLICRQNNNFEFPTLTNSYRFWGLGNLPATPTIAAPVTDGVGFELGLNGQMAAVTYAAGVRTLIANLAAKSLGGSGAQPQDNGVHKYWVYFTGDLTYFAIDNADNVVASFLTGVPGPANNSMATCAVVISNAGSAATLTINAVTVGDTAHTGVAIVDGTYGFRKASVNSGSQNIAPAVNYTAITTSGTTTVANGAGIYFGSYLWALGTSPTIGVLDGTNTLMAVSTATALLQALNPLPAGIGVKFTTSLVVVTGGTASGSWNVLWD